MMLFLLAVIVVAILVYDSYTLKKGLVNLNVTMKFDKRHVEIGETFNVTTTVENKKWLAISYLGIQEQYPLGFSTRLYNFSVFMWPYQRIRREHPMHALNRGELYSELIKLELGNFTGLDSVERTVPHPVRIVVWPATVDMDQNLAAYGSTMGDVTVKRWILDDPLYTTGIREYTGNEPQRYIHWPSSARHNALMVRNFDFTTDNRAMVILNAATMKPSFKSFEADLIEWGISMARSVLETLEDLRIPYGLASNAYNANGQGEKAFYHHAGLGQHHIETQLDALGAISYTGVQIFENTLKNIIKMQGEYATAIVISPRILEEYIEPLNVLAKSVVKMVLITHEVENLDLLSDRIDIFTHKK